MNDNNNDNQCRHALAHVGPRHFRSLIFKWNFWGDWKMFCENPQFLGWPDMYGRGRVCVCIKRETERCYDVGKGTNWAKAFMFSSFTWFIGSRPCVGAVAVLLQQVNAYDDVHFIIFPLMIYNTHAAEDRIYIFNRQWQQHVLTMLPVLNNCLYKQYTRPKEGYDKKIVF